MKEKWQILTAASFLAAGICFVLFPLIRPFFNESQAEFAGRFASNSWIIAHTFGMGGFLFFSLGVLGIYFLLMRSKVESLAFWTLILTWIGTGLTLPFFGAETFALPVIGNEALRQQSDLPLQLINAVRFGPGIIFILLGLLLIGVAAIFLSRVIWTSQIVSRWSGILLAIGLVIFMPILQGDPFFRSIRIVDGFLIFLGCVWIAIDLMKKKIVLNNSY